VTALPRDSVGSAQLRAGAVKESELGNRAVITAKLADQAVTRPKLALGAVTADRVAADALTGAQIDEASLGRVPFAAEATRALTAGRAELADRVELADRATRAASADTAARAVTAEALTALDRNQQDYEIPDAGLLSFEVECDAGHEPVGGGFVRDPAYDWPYLYGSAPVAGAWRLEILDYNSSPGVPVRGTAYAICVKVA
jgi:hypothetical protein